MRMPGTVGFGDMQTMRDPAAPTRLLLADPPWKFGDSLPGKTRGAGKQYKCMDANEIRAFPLPPIADDALLLLWRVASMPQEALDVCKDWGFIPKSEIIWEKLTKTGKPWFGMGRYVRAAHETCIVATRGRFKPASHSVRSRFSCAVPTDEHNKYIHSAKPLEFYEIAEQLAGGPGVELFARRKAYGWIQYGDQLRDEWELRNRE